MRRLLLPLGAVGIALLLVACGSGASADPVKTNQVDLPPSYMFRPKVIEVTAGTTVTWTNHDHFTHSVKFGDGDTHTMKPGESFSLAFDQPGEYDYLCTFHSHDMRGTVIVTAP